MTKSKTRYRMTIDEALTAAQAILSKGRDVELRSVGGYVIVYELNKRVHKVTGAERETPEDGT